MRVLKNLKALFIEETPEAAERPEGPATPETPVSAEPQRDVPQAASSPGEGQPVGQPDDRMMAVLFSAMEENNIQGYDYLEFRDTLKSLQAMPMDEATRFRSAFAMAQTLKTTPEELIRTGKAYLQVLEKEDRKFREALTAREQSDLRSREQQMAALDSEVKSNQERIEALMAEISKARAKMEALGGELKEVTRKMDETRSRFESAYAFIAGQISEDLKKMEKYLK